MKIPKPMNGFGIQSNKTEKSKDENNSKHHKYKIDLYTIILLCVAIFFFIGLAQLAIYSKQMEAYFSYMSKAIYGMLIAAIGEGSIIYSKCRRMKEIYNIILRVCSLTLIVITLAGYCAVAGAITNDLKSTEEEQSSEQKQLAQSANQVTYTLTPYDFETDPFLKTSIELYLGSEVTQLSDAEINDLLAGVVEKDIKREKEKKKADSPSSNYREYFDNAELQYDTYLYQRKRDFKTNYDNKKIRDQRINDLDYAIDEGIMADNEFEDAENRRMIAIRYKDKGDEYNDDKNDAEASIAFEEGAKWCMKACYTSAQKGDHARYDKTITLFQKIVEEMNKLSTISSDRKNILKRNLEIYKLIGTRF